MRIQASRVLQMLTYAINLTLCNHLPSVYDSLPHTDASSHCWGSDSPVWVPSRPVQADSSGYFACHLDWLFSSSCLDPYVLLSCSVSPSSFVVVCCGFRNKLFGKGKEKQTSFPMKYFHYPL